MWNFCLFVCAYFQYFTTKNTKQTHSKFPDFTLYIHKRHIHTETKSSNAPNFTRLLTDRKTVHCWDISFFFPFFFAFPSYISGVHHFGVRFLRMWPFFNPTIKVVTFRLRGWCVLGVFLLPAFTRLGHERQDLLSPCDEMHVCTD